VWSPKDSSAADSSPARGGQRQTRSVTGALAGRQDIIRPSELAIMRRAEAEELSSGGVRRASSSGAGRGAPARAASGQAGSGNRGAQSGAKGGRRASGADHEELEREHENGEDGLVQAISRALEGGHCSASRSLAGLHQLLGRIVQSAQNEGNGPQPAGFQDQGQIPPQAAGRGRGARQPAGRGGQGTAQSVPAGQPSASSLLGGAGRGGGPDSFDIGVLNQARAATTMGPALAGRGRGLQALPQGTAATRDNGKGDTAASKQLATEHRRVHDFLQARCVKEGIASSLSDADAWDQTRRSILFPNLPRTDREMIRQAETILIWTGSNLLDPKQWRSLPRNVIRYMCEKLDVTEKWEEPFGSGATTESLREMFLAISDITPKCARQ
jgi:hypothetical protein